MVLVCLFWSNGVGKKIKKYWKSIHFKLSDLTEEEGKVVCTCACFPYNEVNLDLGTLPEILDLQFVPPKPRLSRS